MNVNQKGNLTELQVMLSAIEKGYTVSIPYGDCDRYDQIWDNKQKLLRVQIKTARWKDERKIAFTFNCYSVVNGKKHKYTSNEIDYLATFWENKCYLIPIEECSLEKTLWYELPPKNYQNCCLAQQYELQEVSKI